MNKKTLQQIFNLRFWSPVLYFEPLILSAKVSMNTAKPATRKRSGPSRLGCLSYLDWINTDSLRVHGIIEGLCVSERFAESIKGQQPTVLGVIFLVG